MGDGGIPRRRIAHGHHPHLSWHPVEIGESSPDRAVAQDPAQSCSDCDLRGRLRGNRSCCGIEKDFVDRRQLAKQPQERDEFRGRGRPHSAIQELRLELARSREQPRLLALSDAGQDMRRHLPRTRSGPRIGICGHISRVQHVRLEAQEGNDLWPHTRAHGPLAPVIEIGFKFQMDETIPKRTRHREMNAPLGGRIASSDHHPAIRQHILSQFAVEY